jgi:hypothetical protein
MLKQLLRRIFESSKQRDPHLIRYSGASYLSDQYGYAKSYSQPGIQHDPAVQIFTHIPKTAGTTLDWITKAICIKYDLAMYRVRGGLHDSILSWNKNSAIDELMQFPREALQTMDFVTGHLPFGIHELLERPFTYITLIREPVFQMISYFNFLVMRNVIERSSTIQDLIKSRNLVDNMQVRQLCGLDSLTGVCDETTLRCAKHNLDNFFSVVGVTDRFDDFVSCWLSANNWPGVAYPLVQVTGKKRVAGTSSALTGLIQDYNKFDCDLYQYVTQQFAARFSRLQSDTVNQSGAAGNREVIIIPLDFADSNRISEVAASVFEAEYGSRGDRR